MPLFNTSEKNPWAYLLEPSLGKIPNQENKRDYYLVSLNDSLKEKTIAVFKDIEDALEIIKLLEAHTYTELKLKRKNIHKDQIFFQNKQMMIQLNENEIFSVWSEVNSIATEEIFKTCQINHCPNDIEKDVLNSEYEFFLSHRSKFDVYFQRIKSKLTSLFCCTHVRD